MIIFAAIILFMVIVRGKILWNSIEIEAFSIETMPLEDIKKTDISQITLEELLNLPLRFFKHCSKEQALFIESCTFDQKKGIQLLSTDKRKTLMHSQLMNEWDKVSEELDLIIEQKNQMNSNNHDIKDNSDHKRKSQENSQTSQKTIKDKEIIYLDLDTKNGINLAFTQTKKQETRKDAKQKIQKNVEEIEKNLKREREQEIDENVKKSRVRKENASLTNSTAISDPSKLIAPNLTIKSSDSSSKAEWSNLDLSHLSFKELNDLPIDFYKNHFTNIHFNQIKYRFQEGIPLLNSLEFQILESIESHLWTLGDKNDAEFSLLDSDVLLFVNPVKALYNTPIASKFLSRITFLDKLSCLPARFSILVNSYGESMPKERFISDFITDLKIECSFYKNIPMLLKQRQEQLSEGKALFLNNKPMAIPASRDRVIKEYKQYFAFE